jgi:hypothetical protein
VRSRVAHSTLRETRCISFRDVAEMLVALAGAPVSTSIFFLGQAEPGKAHDVRVRFCNTTVKYATDALEGLCPRPF